MNKREFIKSSLLVGLASQIPVKSEAEAGSFKKKQKLKNWIWVAPRRRDTDDELKIRYVACKAAGITGIFFDDDSERHFRAAKAAGLEAHRWIVTLNRAELLQVHPDWYTVNRNGDSVVDKPPYVDDYRWLCPSRPEVQQYLENLVSGILDKDYIDGIHLDYVRYCDVILPVNLWDKYKIVQTSELPEYDYCYCAVCQAKFKEQYNYEVKSIQFPDQSLSWRQFRYDNITRIVNAVSVVAHQHKKQITAAVFPTPEVARRIVRQDWTNWNLDGVCPMMYHGFYREPVAWIGDAVTEGVHFLNGKFPLYAGLYLYDFKNQEEIKQGITLALKNGASGISFFGNADQQALDALKEVVSKSIS